MVLLPRPADILFWRSIEHQKAKKKLSKSLKSKWKEIVDEKYEKGMELVMNPVKVGGLFTIWLTEYSASLSIFGYVTFSWICTVLPAMLPTCSLFLGWKHYFVPT